MFKFSFILLIFFCYFCYSFFVIFFCYYYFFFLFFLCCFLPQLDYVFLSDFTGHQQLLSFQLHIL